MRRFQVPWPGRFATERIRSVLACTVRMRDRAKRRGCGAWERRSRLVRNKPGLWQVVSIQLQPASAPSFPQTNRVVSPSGAVRDGVHIILNLFDRDQWSFD